MNLKYLTCFSLFITSFAHAQETTTDLWSGSADLGFTNLTGNTEETTITGQLSINRENKPWNWQNKFESFYSESKKIRTAEKYSALSKLSYNFLPTNYAFGRATYETNKFSGFAYQTSLILGLGWNIYDLETFKWDAEIGGGHRGARIDHPVAGEDKNRDEYIATASTQLDWQFAKTSSFGQYFSYEVGDLSGIFYSSSELRMTIAGDFFFTLTYNVKHTSDVPFGTEKVDTETIGSLTYKF